MLSEPALQTRCERAFEQGSLSQRQVREAFVSRACFAGARQRWTLGCCSIWIEAARKEHHQNLVSPVGRLVIAGEHASQQGCWRPGALLCDAISGPHQRALAA